MITQKLLQPSDVHNLKDIAENTNKRIAAGHRVMVDVGRNAINFRIDEDGDLVCDIVEDINPEGDPIPINQVGTGLVTYVERVYDTPEAEL